MVAIDPTTLKVISQITLPQMIGGRVTTTSFDGKNYIYLPGTKSLYRYTFENGKFAADPTWGPVPYLKSGQTAGSAVAVMGDYVVLMTNGGAPTSTPMSVVAVSQADSKKVVNLQPFRVLGLQEQLHPVNGLGRPGLEPDLRHGRGRGHDRRRRVERREADHQLTAAQTTLSFTTLIGPPDRRVLIGTNIPVKFFKQLKKYTTEQVIWRDAATGKQLAARISSPRCPPASS